MTGTMRREQTNRGGAQRSGRGRGRAKQDMPRDVNISKSLSFLLRHGAKAEGVELDDGGWANLADVVSFNLPYVVLCVRIVTGLPVECPL